MSHCFKSKIRLLFFFLIVFYTGVFGQSANEQRQMDEILDLISTNQYQLADQKLDALLVKSPDNVQALFIKGQNLMRSNKMSEALVLFDKMNTINPSYNPLQYKLMAECNFYLNQLSQASTFATKFLNTPNISKINQLDCEKLVRNIDFVKSQPVSTDKIVFENIGSAINSEYNDYFPSTTADEQYLYFTRKTKSEDIWISKKINGEWATAKPIDEPIYQENGFVTTINSDENDGAHTISPSGKYLFFTSCNRPLNIGSCDLYYAKLNGGEWGQPKMLKPPLNTKSWESQPCITSDAKKLYFVSARAGGIGGSDIYESSILPDGTYSEPVNLGDVINTTGNEDRPFLHPDGKTLYFASEGHPGYGKNDLFMSRYENDAWQKPINLGPQINSYHSELSIFVNALGTTAYIAKQVEQDGKLNFDIFSFKMPENIKPKEVTYLKGTVVNSKTQQPIKTSIKIYNTNTKESVLSLSSDEKNGDFLFTLPLGSEYGFNVNKEGYALYSQNFTFQKSTDNTPQEFKIALQPLEKGATIELRNVFFETGKFELKPQSTIELDNVVDLLKSNPTIHIQISGHTDNVGAEASNKILSENRAQSVMNYIISKGIESSRLNFKGFGSTKPLQSNDSETGRAQNRRTEIEIL